MRTVSLADKRRQDGDDVTADKQNHNPYNDEDKSKHNGLQSADANANGRVV
jgi:hypothetical protein